MAQQLTVQVDDEGKLGPAMLALPTDRMRAFVTAVLVQGSARPNNQEAARAAGYVGIDSTLAVTGHRLAHDERIITAMREEADRRMRSGAALAASVLMDIASNPVHKDQLKAAEALLNRAGLASVSEQRITIDDKRTPAAQIEKIMQLAKVLGIDAVALLGRAGHVAPGAEAKPEVIDAEFTEVRPDDPQVDPENPEGW